MDLAQTAIEAIQAKFPDVLLGTGEHAGQKWAFIQEKSIVPVLTMLRDALSFEFLMDLTAVDYLNQGTPERFSLVYVLYSFKHNDYFRVKTWVSEVNPEADSATGVYKSAGWAEREVWDMYGITFRNHPDLRRILMPMDYQGHPLRKDYPLTGNGERQNFPRYVK